MRRGRGNGGVAMGTGLLSWEGGVAMETEGLLPWEWGWVGVGLGGVTMGIGGWRHGNEEGLLPW